MSCFGVELNGTGTATASLKPLESLVLNQVVPKVMQRTIWLNELTEKEFMSEVCIHLFDAMLEIVVDKRSREGADVNAAIGEQIHFSVACNTCKSNPVCGSRWRCSERLDYNLCQACFTSFDKNGGSDTRHMFCKATDKNVHHKPMPLLHCAAILGNLSVVNKLIQMRANVNGVDINGCSAIQLAAAAGHTGVVAELMSAGAHMYEHAPLGWTPVDLAIIAGHESLALSILGGLHCQDSQVPTRLQQVKQSVAGAQLLAFRGLPCVVRISQDELEFRDFCSLRSKQCCRLGERGYFEVEILEPEIHSCPVGFASAAYVERRVVPDSALSLEGSLKGCPIFLFMQGSGLRHTHCGIGDDDSSWAVDGIRQLKYHQWPTAYTFAWKAGDVLGLACDLQEMQIKVSVNGSFSQPNGLVFELGPGDVLKCKRGLFAAITGTRGKVRCNLGGRPFRHAAPAADYRAFSELQVYTSADADPATDASGDDCGMGGAVSVVDLGVWRGGEKILHGST